MPRVVDNGRMLGGYEDIQRYPGEAVSWVSHLDFTAIRYRAEMLKIVIPVMTQASREFRWWLKMSLTDIEQYLL